MIRTLNPLGKSRGWSAINSRPNGWLAAAQKHPPSLALSIIPYNLPWAWVFVSWLDERTSFIGPGRGEGLSGAATCHAHVNFGALQVPSRVPNLEPIKFGFIV